LKKFFAGVALMAVMTTTGFAQSAKQAWFNQPKTWHGSGDTLTEIVPPGTDYWRIAHYGFIRDTGPFRYQEQAGDFEATVRISGK
jgi:uncharacterized protein